MTIGFAIAIYFVVWWITLFAVLPFGVRAPTEGETVVGADPGAPAAPLLLKKVLATTIIAAFILAAIFAVYPHLGLD